MPFSLRPDEFLPSVLQINSKKLKKEGVTAILFDADNTLFPHDAIRPSAQVISLLRKLQKEFSLAIVTNSSSQSHRKKVESYFNSKGIKLYVGSHTSRKPMKGPFLEAAGALGVPPQKCAMAGDNLFTDVLGANRCGMHSIKVLPVERKTDPAYFWPMRLAEAAAISLM